MTYFATSRIHTLISEYMCFASLSHRWCSKDFSSNSYAATGNQTRVSWLHCTSLRDLNSGRFTDWSTAAAVGSDLNLLKAKTEKNRLESKKYESWSLLCHRKRIGLIWGEEVRDWFSSMTWQNRRIATKLCNSSFPEVWSRDKTLPGLPLPVVSDQKLIDKFYKYFNF